MKHRTGFRTASFRGFSLVEILSVVSVIGLIAAAGYGVFANVTTSIKERKLESELRNLNSAVGSYLAFGGDLSNAKTSADVFNRLRSAAASDMVRRIPGLSSSMIDRRMVAIYQDNNQAATNQLRVRWSPAKKAFEKSTSGAAGIHSFYLADEDDVPAASEDDVRTLTMLYAEKDTWIWDYNEEKASAPAGPTVVTTGNPGTAGTSPPPVVTNPKPPENPNSKLLQPPRFSKSAGDYRVDEFDLKLTLTDPNPSNASDLYYAVDYGPWEKYQSGSSLEVGPDQTISAQAIAKNSQWRDSSRSDQLYSAIAEELLAPTIQLSSSSFGAISNRLVGVVLENPNPEENGQLQYRINDRSWIDYQDYLLLDRLDFPGGVQISARVVPKTSYYNESKVSTKVIAAGALSLSGTGDGVFTNPTGDANLVTNLGGNVVTGLPTSSNYFEWGKITNGAGKTRNGFSKSSLHFNSGNGFNTGLGQDFFIGGLNYHNGTTLLGTNATDVDFNLALNLNIDGMQYGTGFSFDFDIETTKNNGNAWQSADYVAIDQANSTSMFEIDGSTFEVSLKFGDTTSEGFASTDSFHVFEDGTASADVYATVFDRTASRGNVGTDGTAQNTGFGTAELQATAEQNGGWWSNLWGWLTSLFN